MRLARLVFRPGAIPFGEDVDEIGIDIDQDRGGDSVYGNAKVCHRKEASKLSTVYSSVRPINRKVSGAQLSIFVG